MADSISTNTYSKQLILAAWKIKFIYPKLPNLDWRRLREFLSPSLPYNSFTHTLNPELFSLICSLFPPKTPADCLQLFYIGDELRLHLPNIYQEELIKWIQDYKTSHTHLS